MTPYSLLICSVTIGVASLMIGTFADPQEEGSMAIFTTREAAEEFARGDPFVLNGVFELEDLRAWNVYVDELTSRP